MSACTLDVRQSNHIWGLQPCFLNPVHSEARQCGSADSASPHPVKATALLLMQQRETQCNVFLSEGWQAGPGLRGEVCCLNLLFHCWRCYTQLCFLQEGGQHLDVYLCFLVGGKDQCGQVSPQRVHLYVTVGRACQPT